MTPKRKPPPTPAEYEDANSIFDSADFLDDRYTANAETRAQDRARYPHEPRGAKLKKLLKRVGLDRPLPDGVLPTD